eukprot:gene6539-7577_t
MTLKSIIPVFILLVIGLYIIANFKPPTKNNVFDPTSNTDGSFTIAGADFSSFDHGVDFTVEFCGQTIRNPTKLSNSSLKFYMPLATVNKCNVSVHYYHFSTGKVQFMSHYVEVLPHIQFMTYPSKIDGEVSIYGTYFNHPLRVYIDNNPCLHPSLSIHNVITQQQMLVCQNTNELPTFNSRISVESEGVQSRIMSRVGRPTDPNAIPEGSTPPRPLIDYVIMLFLLICGVHLFYNQLLVKAACMGGNLEALIQLTAKCHPILQITEDDLATAVTNKHTHIVNYIFARYSEGESLKIDWIKLFKRTTFNCIAVHLNPDMYQSISEHKINMNRVDLIQKIIMCFFERGPDQKDGASDTQIQMLRYLFNTITIIKDRKDNRLSVYPNSSNDSNNSDLNNIISCTPFFQNYTGGRLDKLSLQFFEVVEMSHRLNVNIKKFPLFLWFYQIVPNLQPCDSPLLEYVLNNSPEYVIGYLFTALVNKGSYTMVTGLMQVCYFKNLQIQDYVSLKVLQHICAGYPSLVKIDGPQLFKSMVQRKDHAAIDFLLDKDTNLMAKYLLTFVEITLAYTNIDVLENLYRRSPATLKIFFSDHTTNSPDTRLTPMVVNHYDRIMTILGDYQSKHGTSTDHLKFELIDIALASIYHGSLGTLKKVIGLSLDKSMDILIEQARHYGTQDMVDLLMTRCPIGYDTNHTVIKIPDVPFTFENNIFLLGKHLAPMTPTQVMEYYKTYRHRIFLCVDTLEFFRQTYNIKCKSFKKYKEVWDKCTVCYGLQALFKYLVDTGVVGIRRVMKYYSRSLRRAYMINRDDLMEKSAFRKYLKSPRFHSRKVPKVKSPKDIIVV